jgi:hypothetical protein
MYMGEREDLGYIPYPREKAQLHVLHSPYQAHMPSVGPSRLRSFSTRKPRPTVHMERATVGPNYTPKISTRLCRSMPSNVGRSVHAPTARALDLRRFRQVSVARSYVQIASCIALKVSGCVTKTATSSAYAITGPCVICRPIFILSRISSSARKRGCRHKAKITTLRGHPCRTPLRIGIQPTTDTFICTVAVTWSYKA